MLNNKRNSRDCKSFVLTMVMPQHSVIKLMTKTTGENYEYPNQNRS
jgi:hypothetical protein